MSAPIISSNLKSYKDVEKIASKIVKDFKAFVKNNIANGNVVTYKLDVTMMGHGDKPFGAGASADSYIDLKITYGSDSLYINNFIDKLGRRDVEAIGKEICSQIYGLRLAKKGHLYDEVRIEYEDIYLHYGFRWDADFRFPKKIRVFSKPCKEFTKLSNYLVKYGCFAIPLDKCYNVRLFGKRGEYDESGDKSFICYKPNTCAVLLERIKKLKGSKDIISLEYVKDDDIDTEYSIRYETECYGIRSVMPKVSVKTPNGKLKGVV